MYSIIFVFNDIPFANISTYYTGTYMYTECAVTIQLSCRSDITTKQIVTRLVINKK